MNQVLQTLHARKSVRAYQERPIAPEDKEAILLAALAAPSAGNQQLYTILDITDRALLQALAESCDQQPFIATAPLALIFCADQQKWLDAYRLGGCQPREPGPGDLMLAVADACIAAQNAVTAAESLGIGSCYIGDIMERCEEHRRMLHLPPLVFPVVLLVFGYPSAQQLARPKPPRSALHHIVHENGYRHMAPAELTDMLQKDDRDQPFEAWIGAFCRRKYNADFSREMSRSVGRYLAAYGGEGGAEKPRE
ncbi:MAG: nitroreductase family protein [Christensenellales bacterium]